MMHKDHLWSYFSFLTRLKKLYTAVDAVIFTSSGMKGFELILVELAEGFSNLKE